MPLVSENIIGIYNSNINKDNCILVNRISNVQKKDIIIAKKAGYKYLDLRKFNLKNLKITKIKSPYSKIFDNFFLNKIFKNYFYQKATWKYIFRK